VDSLVDAYRDLLTHSLTPPIDSVTPTGHPKVQIRWHPTRDIQALANKHWRQKSPVL